jgi:sigma-B regulation protein RsbU (phosphoserine phosphatase)
MAALKVLVADDDAASRAVLRGTLRKLGHVCVEAASGGEAWEMYRREAPALVLADWMMPGVDGLELCRMIRAERRPRYPYVILVTALGGKGSYLRGMAAGADDFVSKPFDVDEMTARLRVGERIISLQDEIRQLHGLLPICSYCRRIRDAANEWSDLETYVARQTEATFSHSICPSCFDTKIETEISRLGTDEASEKPHGS